MSKGGIDGYKAGKQAGRYSRQAGKQTGRKEGKQAGKKVVLARKYSIYSTVQCPPALARAPRSSETTSAAVWALVSGWVLRLQ